MTKILHMKRVFEYALANDRVLKCVIANDRVLKFALANDRVLKFALANDRVLKCALAGYFSDDCLYAYISFYSLDCDIVQHNDNFPPG